MQSLKELQEQACSAYDRRKFCTYDVEFIKEKTIPIIHQTARFWYVKKGKAVININGSRYEAKEGCFLCILPWCTTLVEEVTEPISMIKIIFNSDLIYTSLRNGYNEEGDSLKIYKPIREYPMIHLTEKEKEKYKNIFREIKEQVGVESIISNNKYVDYRSLLIVNKLMELLILYNKHIFEAGQRNEKPLQDKKAEMLQYIYSHIASHPTIEELSDIFDMKEEEIEKELNERTGMSLSALSNEMRMSKTNDFLIYTDLALTDIAFLVGYTDASHLVRTFKSRTGYSPKEYRKVYSTGTKNLDIDLKKKGFLIVSYIGNHFTEDLKALCVSKKYSMTVFEMNKLLLYVVEKNFDNFLNYLRINQAIKLLFETRESLVDIAIDVGYNNVKTFSRNFIKARGITPGEFRKKYILQEALES